MQFSQGYVTSRWWNWNRIQVAYILSPWLKIFKAEKEKIRALGKGTGEEVKDKIFVSYIKICEGLSCKNGTKFILCIASQEGGL